MTEIVVNLVYFAWVRERIGLSEEEIIIPEEVATVRDLLTWLRGRGDEYETALRHQDIIRVAIDREHVAHGERVAGASEIALFPPMTGG